MTDILFKKIFWAILIIFLSTLTWSSATLGSFLKSQENSTPPVRTITVSAEGKAVAIPDIVTFNFAVVTEGESVKLITDENSRKVKSTIDFIRNKGVDEKDIKTVGFNISPKYNYDRFTGKSSIYGYTVNNMVMVKVRDFDILSDLLDGIIEHGINEINALIFDVDDKDKYQNDARNMAFEKAREKAKMMTQANEVRIKRIVTFSEAGGDFYPRPLYYGKGGAVALEAASAPPIEEGSQEIRVNVSVTYEIE